MPSGAEPERQVLEDVQVRIERQVLEDHRDISVAGREPIGPHASDPEAPRIRRLQPGDQPQERALARTRRPDDHEQRTSADRQVNRGDRLHPARIGLRNAAQLDLSQRFSPSIRDTDPKNPSAEKGPSIL